MATAATSTYNTNRGRAVQLALTDVGAIGPGVINPAADAAPLLAHADDLLSQLILSMDADGSLTWRVHRRTLTTISGTADYILANDVSDVENPIRYTLAGQTSGSIVTPMTLAEYQSLGDRTLPVDTPIRYFAEKALDSTGMQFVTLHFYPVPDASGNTAEYSAVVKARDQTTDAQTLDVPSMWIRCLRYGLALDLAPAYGLPMDRINFFRSMFTEERERLLNQDMDHADIQIVAFGSSYYGNSYNYGRGGYR